MKQIFRKTVIVFVLLSMLFVIPACGGSGSDKIAVSDLGKYTIVYPAEYQDWQMEEVVLLQNVIEHITGKKIAAVPDTEAEKSREIILASSSRQTAVTEQVNAFANDMDYIITVSDGDLILGGKSYYGDMKAIYDLVNNYLGYDDLENIYTDPLSEIADTKTEIYKEPIFTIMVANPGKYPFSSAKDVKVMAEAGFNMTKLDISKFTAESFYTYAKWCARFNVRILQKTVYNLKTKEFNINDLEFSTTNPIIYGHYVRYEKETNDFARYSEMCDIYKEKYAKYGWKLVMNLSGGEDATLFEEAYEDDSIFKNADIISASCGLGIGQSGYIREFARLDMVNEFKKIASRNSNEFWMTVAESTGVIDSTIEKTPNAFRWKAYLALSFGVTGVEYSLYKRGNVINDDYTKGSRYDDIKQINEELLKMAEVYTQYEQLGVYVVNQQYDDTFTEIEDQYTGFGNVLTEFIPAAGYDTTSYLIGCFKAKDSSDKYAFVAVDLTEVSEIKTVMPASMFALNGEKVTQYKNGEPTELTITKTGYYAASISNGCGIFVTIE